MRTSILIPIYKSNPSEYEIISFDKCLRTLSKYDIYIVTFRELDLYIYKEISKRNNKDIQFSYFDRSYFSSLRGYNKLMMCQDFYLSFKDYDYMLVYQLDAYVFRNDLDYWCNLNYDYIGSPWFEDHKSYEDGKSLWKVGNGGLSLRKVSKFIEVTNKKNYKLNYKFYYDYFKSFNAPKYKSAIISFICTFFFKYKINEDYFLIYLSDYLNMGIKVPDIPLAIDFAFEKSPSYLYVLNNNKLPFACHAFEKNEFNSFWSKFIK